MFCCVKIHKKNGTESRFLRICQEFLPFHRNGDHVLDVRDVLAEGLVGGHQVLDGGAGMQDGRVVLAAELGADGRERAVRDEVPALVHRDLARLDDLALAGLGEQDVAGDVEVLAHGVHDQVDGDVRLLLADDLAGDALRQGHGDFPVAQL